MDVVIGATFVAMGLYFGMLAIASAIIRGAVILADRRDLEKRIEEG